MESSSEDMVQSTEPTSEVTWPAVPFAYEFVIPSFDWMSQRLNAVEARLQTLIGFAATVTVAAPVLATAVLKQPKFDSMWFIWGVLMFFAIAAVGIAVLNTGDLQIISPQMVYKKYLHYSEWEFKKNILYSAGQGFEANANLVKTKGTVLTILSIVFLGQILLLVVCIATGIG
jgi:hypothetical protein